ncbi:MAG: TusE/DsrC/DsvC family sulfur relay protein [Granulosicoccus sp.]|nr:TusE/DsrC/DsvC family sulfur relay protein [Granulosicoccus sp.]
MIQQLKTTYRQQNINGYLKYRSDWNESVAQRVAERDGLILTEKHWDVIHFLRTEYYANNGTVPLETKIIQAMAKEWKTHLSYADMNTLFPGGANVQGAKIAGCVTIKSVGDLLDIKGDDVWSVKPDQLLIDAIQLLTEKNIGALMVVERSTLVGVVSERDLTRQIVLGEKSLETTQVKEIMSTNVVSVSSEDSLDSCMSLMTEYKFRHLPVVDESRLIGVLSMPDLVKVIVEQQQFTITQLQEKTHCA